MKSNKILYIFLLIPFLINSGYAQGHTCNGDFTPRNILTVPGAPGNSFRWSPSIMDMKNSTSGNYFINDITDSNIFSRKERIPVGITQLQSNINLPILESPTNILGLGHDVGGLALRGLSESDSRITGQIIVGTPNQGSELLRDLYTEIDVNGNPLIFAFFDDLDRFRGDAKCEDCDKIGALRDQINGLRNSPYGAEGVRNPSSYYNSLSDPDPSTTAVIWGNAGEQTLSDLLGSRSSIFQSSSIDLESCASTLKAKRESELTSRVVANQINCVTGFGGVITSVVKGIKSFLGEEGIPFTISNAANAIKTIIDTRSEAIKNKIKESKDIDEETRRLLICELANQRLEVEWRIRVSGTNGTFLDIETDNPNYNQELCEEASYNCQYNTQHPNHEAFCITANLYCHDVMTIFRFEESDLVYTKSEQLIDNFSGFIAEVAANHYDEQDYNVIQDPIDFLFSGQNGAAFCVPRAQ